MTLPRALATVLSLALLAGAAPPSEAHAEGAQAAAPSPRERLGGTFAFVGGSKEVAAKDAAVEKSTDSLFFAIRGMARSKLREVTAVSQTVSLRFHDGNVTVTTADGPPSTSPDNGAAVRFKNREGKPATLTQKLTADALQHKVSTDSGSREVTYSASKDGKTLTVTHVISSPRLPTPVRYTLHYQRRS